MRITGGAEIEEFGMRHGDARRHLETWLSTVQNADWDAPHELMGRFSNVRAIGGGRVIFNIRGNRYRLVAAINYQQKVVQIRFIGTHAEYDRIDALEAQNDFRQTDPES